MSRADEQSLVRVELDSSGALHIGANISKREHFAAMAMQGLLSDTSRVEPRCREEDAAAGMAKLAVLCADSLISELEKKD